jgi:hypothetical protein
MKLLSFAVELPNPLRELGYKNGLMQLEEGIPMDSNGFKPSYSFIMHFLLSQYFTAVL